MASADPPPSGRAPLHRIGVVVADADGRRWLAVPRSGCSGCGAQGTGCGLSRLAPTSSARFPLPAGHGAAPGQTLEIAVAPAALLHAALLGYLLPAFGLVLGAALGNGLGADPGAVTGAVPGLFVGLALARRSGPPAALVMAPPAAAERPPRVAQTCVRSTVLSTLP